MNDIQRQSLRKHIREAPMLLKTLKKLKKTMSIRNFEYAINIMAKEAAHGFTYDHPGEKAGELTTELALILKEELLTAKEKRDADLDRKA